MGPTGASVCDGYARSLVGRKKGYDTTNMELPRKKSFYAILSVYVLVLCLSAAGYSLFGIATGVLTTFIAIWKHLASEQVVQENESLVETQARMHLRSGSGNLYNQLIDDEIKKSGRAINIRKRVEKSLEIEPDNEFALTYLAGSLALSVSRWHGRGEKINPDDVKDLRELCDKGRELYPSQPMFLLALGVVADSVGEHNDAREWYEKSSRIGEQENPSWRMSTATSLGMTGEHKQALEQLQSAQSEGLSVWMLDFYMGRTLCELCRFDEALICLHRARKQRRLRSDIVHWIHLVHMRKLEMAKSAYYSLAAAILHMIGEPCRGLIDLGSACLYAFFVALRWTCRTIYLWLAWLWPRRATMFESVLNPDMLYVEVSAPLLKHRNYTGAEYVCRKGLETLPESLRLRVNLAESLSCQDRKEEALAEIEKSLIRFPKNEVLIRNKNTLLKARAQNPAVVNSAHESDKS